MKRSMPWCSCEYVFHPSSSSQKLTVCRSRAMNRLRRPRLPSLLSSLSFISRRDDSADAANLENDLDTDEVPKLDVANWVSQRKHASSSFILSRSWNFSSPTPASTGDCM